MVRDVLVDDVGSFPILKEKRDLFDEHYLKAYNELVNNNNDVSAILDHRGLKYHVYEPIIRSFRMKLATGLDVVNYPQHFDMNLQFSRPIDLYPPKSGDVVPYLIDPSMAIVPEVLFIQHHVNNTPVEELGIPEYSASAKQVQLKVCITGPIELYIKSDMGFTVYKEILANLSKSVNAFAKSSIINDARIRTAVICIDEPSLGFINLFNIEERELVECLDMALADIPGDVVKQIHLHSLADARLPLQTKNIDVLTCEYASDPTNVIGREQLEQFHKKMRVGICRTNYNAIIGKMYEEGIVVGTGYEDQIGLVDSEEKIATALASATDHYGRENLAFVGPDCGLSSWSPPELAQLLLKRVVSVVQNSG
jgi:5-methyltetrahydropteroyltriglutamate--homocysteine methyltransferase